MLTGIDPLLTGEILKILDEMGHSDALVIADANFPAHRTAVRVVETPGVDIVSMVRAVRSVFPLDEDHPPALMDSGLTPTPGVQTEILARALIQSSPATTTWLSVRSKRARTAEWPFLTTSPSPVSTTSRALATCFPR